MAENEALILREQRGKILIITINRPAKGNSVLPEMAVLMDQYLNEAEKDDSVAAVILTAAGGKCFCGGMDLKFLNEHPDRLHETWAGDHGWFGITERYFEKPLIAAVNGAALGGGTEISLACDLIVASETAKFGLPEVKRGIFAGAGGPIRLAKQLPRAYALEMVMTGDGITAQRAKEIGMVTQVVPADQVLDAAIALAERIVCNAPLCVKATKAIVYKSLEVSQEEAFRFSDDLFWNKIMPSADAKEGPKAFAEKREPNWQGR